MYVLNDKFDDGQLRNLNDFFINGKRINCHDRYSTILLIMDILKGYASQQPLDDKNASLLCSIAKFSSKLASYTEW